jgi:hypothetical protein
MTTMSKRNAETDTVRSGNQFALSSDNSQVLAKAAQSWFAASTECQREMLSFVSMRLAKDGDTLREVLGCKNLADMTTLQSRWMEDALRDYNSEMSKLMSIYSNSVNG